MTLKKRGSKISIDRVQKIPTGSLSESWWTKHAAPESRNEFALAAAERNETRTHEVNIRSMRQVYTQGAMRTGRKV